MLVCVFIHVFEPPCPALDWAPWTLFRAQCKWELLSERQLLWPPCHLNLPHPNFLYMALACILTTTSACCLGTSVDFYWPWPGHWSCSCFWIVTSPGQLLLGCPDYDSSPSTWTFLYLTGVPASLCRPDLSILSSTAAFRLSSKLLLCLDQQKAPVPPLTLLYPVSNARVYWPRVVREALISTWPLPGPW